MTRRERRRWVRLCERTAREDRRKILCSFCEFMVCHRDFESTECGCEHPLGAIRYRQSEIAWEGGDCGGFAPKVTFEQATRSALALAAGGEG